MQTLLLKVLALLGACALLMGIGAYGGHRYESARYNAKLASIQKSIDEATIKAEASARATERAQTLAQQAIMDSYSKGQQDAQANADKIIADLRAGNLRLRREWSQAVTSGVSNTAAATAIAARTAQLRYESASRIVRAADECDNQVKALQAIALNDRKAVGVKP